MTLVLHLEFKLQYFKNAKWKETWIKTAEEMICIEWPGKWSKAGDVEEITVEEQLTTTVCNSPRTCLCCVLTQN